MAKDKVIKQYFRFLKDNGVFRRVICVHSMFRINNLDVRRTDTVIQYLKLFEPTQYLSNTMCVGNWDKFEEGRPFWWALDFLWRFKIIEEMPNRIDKVTYVNPLQYVVSLSRALSMMKCVGDYYKLPYNLKSKIDTADAKLTNMIYEARNKNKLRVW